MGVSELESPESADSAAYWLTSYGVVPDQAMRRAIELAARGQLKAASTRKLRSSSGRGKFFGAGEESPTGIAFRAIATSRLSAGNKFQMLLWAAEFAPEHAAQARDDSAFDDTATSLHAFIAAAQTCRGLAASSASSMAPIGTVEPKLPAEFQETLNSLTPAQRVILPHLLSAQTEEEIARRMFRSRHTVHSHAKDIYAIFRVRTRLELVLLFNRGTEIAALIASQAPIPADAQLGTAEKP